MDKRIEDKIAYKVVKPDPVAPQAFSDAGAAVEALETLYARSTGFLMDAFQGLADGIPAATRFRAFYPQVRLETTRFDQIDTRLSYGYVSAPGIYTTTITRPSLFRAYLNDQLRLLIRNHGVPVIVSDSQTPIPVHFAFGDGAHVESRVAEKLTVPLRDLFDTPDLSTTDDEIANGSYEAGPGDPDPLAPFTAQRIDYSLAPASHYTATSPQHFQNFVLFTNYQFYIDEFCAYARHLMAEGGGGYEPSSSPAIS